MRRAHRLPHEELVIGGETGYLLEPRLRRDMVEQVIATLEPSGEPGAVQPKRVRLPRPGDNDAKGLALRIWVRSSG